jgi:glycosyltransferase involved in cell wall biosynthesis
VRVVRVYHAGRSAGHRARERALVSAGVDVKLVVPSNWTEGGAELKLTDEPFDLVELEVTRPNDVNRHRYADGGALRRAILDFEPDLVDVHEEALSAVMRQVLTLLPERLPSVAYAAQNVNKRYPPPFPAWERAAFGRLAALYPCSRQAAAVARERGFGGLIRVLPLGVDSSIYEPGQQRHDDDCFRLALIGRLVEEKGIRDALHAVSVLRRQRRVELVLAGTGELSGELDSLVAELGVSDVVTRHSWLSTEEVADIYRTSHVVLVPSKATNRWVEQFGRMIVEGQACGAVVVGYASGSINEVSSGAALLCAEGDLAGLAAALGDLASLPQLWAGLRERGLALSPSRSWTSVAGAQAALYGEAITETQGPVCAEMSDFGGSAMLDGAVRRPFALPGLRDMKALARLMSRDSQNGLGA